MRSVISDAVTRTLGAVVLLSACTCTTTRTSKSNETTPLRAFADTQNIQCPSAMPAYDPTPAQIERDEIFTLLAYAVVRKDWQTKRGPSSRGYNIGSVLVDSEDNIVCWARNSVGVTGNKTQHGEVRIMTNYLGNVPATSLPGYKLYTTLEPCAMCSGMMTLQSVALTVYGQTDPGFGDALERLELDSTSCGGYRPYPRAVISVPSTTNARKTLDEEYAKVTRGGITKWLASQTAKGIYDDAYQDFISYDVKYRENGPILEAAHAFLDAVPDSYTAIPYTNSCPPQ